jgi:hypothetical protein
MADSRKRRPPRKSEKRFKEKGKDFLKDKGKEPRKDAGAVRRPSSWRDKDKDKEPKPWRGTETPPPWGGKGMPPPWGGKDMPPPWGGKDMPPAWGGKDMPPPWSGKDMPPRWGGKGPSPWGPGPWRDADVYVRGDAVSVVLDRRTAENMYYALALALSGVSWPEAAGRWARMGKTPMGYDKGRSPKDAGPKDPWAR